MNHQIAAVTAMNIAALVFCAMALNFLADTPQLMTKALLMAQIPMLLSGLGGLASIHGEWLKGLHARRNMFVPLPLNERVRHAVWLATLPATPTRSR